MRRTNPWVQVAVLPVRRTARVALTLLAFFLAALLLFVLICIVLPLHIAQAAGGSSGGPLAVEIVAGYNLVVDSNASSPSTFAPSVATVMGRFCNTGTIAIHGVQGYIGNYGAGTPGIYPARDSLSFGSSHPLYNTGVYSFTHLGGRLGTSDAARYVGTLQPGECKVQYWHFKYPQCSEADRTPPCTGIPVGGLGQA
jgi:hypothetical protein